MTDAPEKLWAWHFMPSKQNSVMTGGWHESPDRKETEYIRKDISDARIEKLKEALVDSNEALSGFVDLARVHREGYETPLSAYDRGVAVLMEETNK
jgi:hypothetical protein